MFRRSNFNQFGLHRMLGLLIGVFLYFQNTLSAQDGQSIGLTNYDASVSAGYVLFSNSHFTYLIDECGLVVHSWESAYDPGLALYLLDNGDLLRTARINGSFSGGGLGGRIECFSWEGQLKWAFELANNNFHLHHDIEVLPNGNILALASEYQSVNSAKAAGWKHDNPVYSERIFELKILPDHQVEIVWEWVMWDHLVQDVYPDKENFGVLPDSPGKIDINHVDFESADPFSLAHLNAISYNHANGLIAVSSRNYNEIWLIAHGSDGALINRFGNPTTTNTGSAADQLLFGPHDVRWHENQIMIFNNNWSDQASSICIWDPTYDNFEIIYEDGSLYSQIMSGAHALRTGGLFICEGVTGRLLEVNQQGDILWEYINPVNRYSGPMAQGADPRNNELFRGTKYAVDYPAFINRTLTGEFPLEINPWQSICDPNLYPISEYYDESSVDLRHLDFLGMIELICTAPNAVFEIQIININGQLILQKNLQNGSSIIDLSRHPSGIYFARITDGKWVTLIEKIGLYK